MRIPLNLHKEIILSNIKKVSDKNENNKKNEVVENKKIDKSEIEDEIQNYKYTICKIVGVGANCIVYDAYYYDSINLKHKVRLKELYPINLDIKRDCSDRLIIPEQSVEKFKISSDIFIDSYKKNILFQAKENTANSTSSTNQILFGNNTMYMVINYDNGISYDKVKNESLHDIFKVSLSLTRIISKYHQAGYLHLDIKPENILKLPETNELIILFDFGSVELKKDIQSGNIKNLSYSQRWAAPEQIQCRYKKISEATDFYAIGAIVFERIMGRCVEGKDRKLSSDWSFDLNSDKFEGANPKLIRALKVFFKKTLSSSIMCRYKKIEDLIRDLEKLIEYTLPNSLFIKSNFIKNDNLFIGRTDELNVISKKLKDKTNAVFLRGFGGIGKSVLAKEYAYLNKDKYDAIVFANFSTSIKAMVLDSMQIPIANFSMFEDEKEEDFYERKIRKLTELSDDKTLIIIDNFDVEEDDNLEDIINCGAKFIITTRMDFSDYNYHQINIEEFDDMSDLTKLFSSYNDIDYSYEDKKIIEEIIEIVQRHTMTVELIAKQLRITGMNPRILYDRLISIDGIAAIESSKIKHRKDRKLNNHTILKHLNILFDMSNLNQTSKNVLMNLSLLSGFIVDRNVISNWCKIDDFDTITELIDRGWVEYKNNKISLHQVIVDLVYSKLKPNALNCKELTAFISEKIDKGDYKNTEQRAQYFDLFRSFEKRISGETLDLARFYFSMGKLSISREKCESIDYINKSKDIYMSIVGENSMEVAKCYYELANFYIKLSKSIDILDFCEGIEVIDSIKKYFDKYMDILKKLSDISKLEISDEYIKIADYLYENGNDIYLITEKDEIQKYCDYIEEEYLKGLKIRERISGKKHTKTIDIYNKLYKFYINDDFSIIFKQEKEGDLEKSLIYGNLAISDDDKSHKLEVEDLDYVKLGDISVGLEEYALAEDYYKRGLEDFKSGKNMSYFIEEIYQKIIDLYTITREYDNAIEYAKKIESLDKFYGVNYGGSHIILSKIYKLKGDFEKSIFILENAFKYEMNLIKEKSEKKGISITSNDNIEDYLYDYGYECELAIEISLKIIELALDQNDLDKYNKYKDLAMDIYNKHLKNINKESYCIAEFFELIGDTMSNLQPKESCEYYIESAVIYNNRLESDKAHNLIKKAEDTYNKFKLNDDKIYFNLNYTLSQILENMFEDEDKIYNSYLKTYKIIENKNIENYKRNIILDKLGRYCDDYDEKEEYCYLCDYYEIAKYEIEHSDEKDIDSIVKFGDAGNEYKSNYRYEDAIKCYKLALDNFEKLQNINEDFMGDIYNSNWYYTDLCKHIADVYLEKEEYIKSEEYIYKSIEFIKSKRDLGKLKDYTYITFLKLYENLSKCYKLQKKYDRYLMLQFLMIGVYNNPNNCESFDVHFDNIEYLFDIYNKDMDTIYQECELKKLIFSPEFKIDIESRYDYDIISCFKNIISVAKILKDINLLKLSEEKLKSIKDDSFSKK